MTKNIRQLKEFLEISLRGNIIVVTIGPLTKIVLKENAVLVNVMPEAYKMGPMVKALSDYLSTRESPKRGIGASHQNICVD